MPATIVGTDGDDRISGTAADDVIHGLGGSDEVVGSGGNDTICGGTGGDVLRGEGGNDELVGEGGPDSIWGGDGIDNVWGDEGADALHGGAGTDNVIGHAGDDLMDGGPGIDIANFSGATGRVTASLESGMSRGEGTDRLLSIEWVAGSRYGDVLTGAKGDDRLEGWKGDDTLDGREGRDTLDGGDGRDLCLNGEVVRNCEESQGAVTNLVAVGFDKAAGDGGAAAVWISRDGLAWSRVPHVEAVFGGPSRQEMLDVAAAGPGFVAVGFDYGAGAAAAVWTSRDGRTWSRVPHNESLFGGALSRQLMWSVTAGGPGVVAVGREDGAGAAVWTSRDGRTWSRVPHTNTVFGSGQMFGVTAGGPGVVAVGWEERAGEENAAVWISPNGRSWSRVPHNEAVFGDVSRRQVMRSVTSGGPGVVAGGWDGVLGGDEDVAVWTSRDGSVWRRAPHDEAIFGGRRLIWPGVTDLVSAGPGLVAVGLDSVWTSGDARTWRRRSLSGSLSSVTVGGPGLVAVGERNASSAVWTSRDGRAWRRVPHDDAIFGAAHSTYMSSVAPRRGAFPPTSAGGLHLVGTSRNDTLRGGPGDDVLDGRGGDDVLVGDTGDDRLTGGLGNDRIVCGPGNDLAHTRDKSRDAISCGKGRDTVVADRIDRVASDCELVRRGGAIAGRIVFSADEVITLVNPDGSNRTRLGPGDDPAFSSDGLRIAFVRWVGRKRTDVWVMDAEGTNARRIALNGRAPTWSPDGTRIVYTTTAGSRSYLVEVGIDGTRRKQLFRSNPSGNPTFSPDGRFIAFEGIDDHIWVGASDGSSSSRLSPIGGVEPDWSPKGNTIVFVRGYGGDLYLISRNGSALHRLTSGGSLNASPAFSPDGARIVFARKQESWDLYTVKTSGSDLRRITGSPETEWRPDWGK